MFGLTWKSETKKQPKEEVFGRTSLRTSGQKLRSGPPKLEKTSIGGRGHAAWTSTKKNFGLKNFGLIFSFPRKVSVAIFVVRASGQA